MDYITVLIILVSFALVMAIAKAIQLLAAEIIETVVKKRRHRRRKGVKRWMR